MSGTRIEELNDQAGTFVDMVLNDEISGGELKAAPKGLPYSDAEVHAFLSSINEHRVQGQPTGIILTEGQSGLSEQIKKQLDKPEFQQLNAVLKLFPLSVDKTAANKKLVNQAEIEKINYFLDENDKNIIFALQMNSLRDESAIYKELHRLKKTYPSKQVIVKSPPPVVDAPKPVKPAVAAASSTAHVLAGTQSAPSSVAPSSTAKKVNCFKALPIFKKHINIENVAYEFKFDEETQASSVKVDMYKVGQSVALGSFVIAQDKITAYKMTVEIAVAMIKAYMEANPGEPMEIKPKDKVAHGFFAEAAKRLKNDLDKINYTINAVDGLEKIDVRSGKEQASKIKMPTQTASEPVPAATSSNTPASVPEVEKPDAMPTKQAVVEPSKAADVAPVPPLVSTAPDLPGEDYHLQSLADGNCLFNSFALGLLKIQKSGVKVSPTLQAFINENIAIFSLDVDSFQQQLAIKLRELSSTLSYKHRDTNSFQLADPLWALYNQSQSNQPHDDDIFSPHTFIKEKFKEKGLTYEQLFDWWLDIGYSQFLIEMKEDGCWAGDLELKELATHFSVNVNIIDLNTASENNKPVLHLYAMKLDTSMLSLMEKDTLVKLGVVREDGDEELNSLALNPQQLEKTLRNIDVLRKNPPSEKGSMADHLKRFTPQLIELGVMAKEGNKVISPYSDISNRLEIYSKIYPQLAKLNQQIKDKPVISLQHSGKHWDMMYEAPRPQFTPSR